MIILKIMSATNAIHVVLVVLIVTIRKRKDIRVVWINHKSKTVVFRKCCFSQKYAEEYSDKL